MSSAPSSEKITPVILCGGSGTRLWPLSRAALPKQMLDLTGGGTMLALTAARVENAELFNPAIVVAGEDQAEAILAEMTGIASLVLEPVARNTAPAILLGAVEAGRLTGPEQVILVLPSDHLIHDVDAFNDAVQRALPLARAGWLVTFGMKAERPETGYGYVERGAALAEGVFQAKRFVEKPDAETAAGFVAGGGFDWNSGIFLMRARDYYDALGKYAPDILRLGESAHDHRRDGIRVYADSSWFGQMPAVSIDVAVMEKSDKVAVAPVSAGWSDIGSFAALHQVLAPDGDGNVLEGHALAIDAKGCLVRSDGPMVAVIGVENLVVVATGDAVLVVPRDQSQRVKEAVDALKDREDGRWI
jgi:mannose-1-phosphate guanylyltransferase/mannose-1-phosphate guanylyltransferase/mannose-6-phosphate isomerase